MSYCRWSSDDWRCDIYAYESGDCWVIHVAGNRVVGDVPDTPIYPGPNVTTEERDIWIEEFAEAHRAQMEFLDGCERKDIDLPFAGESFDCATLSDFKEKMLMLRGVGYRFPDSVLEEIDEEMAVG